MIIKMSLQHFGGRGGASNITPNHMTEAALNYKPYQYGQITRYEAGVIYKAVKNGDITAKPETTKELYDETNAHLRFSRERYSQDHLYYENIYNATRDILNNDFKGAQEKITEWENKNINRSTQKSKWYKYKN